MTDNISFLWDTAIMLELGWKRSRSNVQIQLMLLKIYGELGEETAYFTNMLCDLQKPDTMVHVEIFSIKPLCKKAFHKKLMVIL